MGMGAVALAEETYEPSALARLLHSLPHLNVHLQLVNSTFDPKSEIYLESLGILGSIPAAWLILTLLVLLIYLLTRCCDHEQRPNKSISALKVSLAIIAVLCCGAIGLGLYGNDDLHNGLMHVLNEGYRVDLLLTSIANHTMAITTSLQNRVAKQLDELRDIFEGPVTNLTAVQQLTKRLDNAINTSQDACSGATKDINKFLKGITIAPALATAEHYEAMRWAVTMAVLSVLLVLCVILLVGVARHSRCALIMFSVCGLLAVIASWLMASVYLASTVALADLCVDPDRYFISASSPMPPEVLLYYTHCESARSNPFTMNLRIARNSLELTRKSLQWLKLPAIEVFRHSELEPKFGLLSTEVNSAERLISSLVTLVDCKALHGHYMEGMRGLCHVGLLGLALMLLSSILSGLLFTVLVWVDSHTWIYIRKRRDYHQVDETDQYLPPSAASQAIAARTLQRSQGSCYTPDTPPPSYTSVVMHVQPHPHDHSPLEMQSLLTDGCDMRPTESSRSGGAAGHLSHIRGHTLGRLPSHNTQDHSISLTGNKAGANNGKYATLSKQCKTLESSDFY